jgi:hypothetical protein
VYSGLLLLLVLTSTAEGQEFLLSYTTNKGTITITGNSGLYPGFSGSLFIPSTINGLPVTGISGLSDCPVCPWPEIISPTNVVIPSSVTNILTSAFDGCAGLTSITVDVSNSAYVSISGVLFDKNQTRLLRYPSGLAGGYAIPSTVTSVGANAFAVCSNLTSIIIPDGVTNIGAGAFYFCGAVTGITIPTNVTDLGYAAFNACTGLTNVTLPNSITNIGQIAFSSCTSLASVTIPNKLSSIAPNTFSFCINLTTVSMPASITSIGLGAFWSCTSLAAISLPDGVTNIGEIAFLQCTNLANVTFPKNLISIADSAFSACTPLTNVMFSDKLTSVGNSAFSGCARLIAVYFQGNAPIDGGNLFYNADDTIVYYMPGTLGWGPTFSGRPTALWRVTLPYPVILNDATLGVQSNQFGFTIYWLSAHSVVIEASTSLINSGWQSLQTNTFTNGFSFRDAQWTNYSKRFYRIRSP